VKPPDHEPHRHIRLVTSADAGVGDEHRKFEIEFLDPGVRAFVFMFG